MNFLLIEGEGAPEGQQYINAVQTLYPVAYALKFLVKRSKSIDYGVMPLESLWWMKDTTQFSVKRKDEWKWTAMIMQPKIVTEADFKEALVPGEKEKSSGH